jgi:hypothetical protein
MPAKAMPYSAPEKKTMPSRKHQPATLRSLDGYRSAIRPVKTSANA